jgi:hypothetical protein
MNYLDTLTLARDMHYDHEPKVVPLFRNRADAVLQAHTSHLAVEADRMAAKTDAELDAEYLRLLTQEAWDAFMTCVRKRQSWDDKVNEAHKRWWELNSELAKVKT